MVLANSFGYTHRVLRKVNYMKQWEGGRSDIQQIRFTDIGYTFLEVKFTLCL